MIVIRVDLHHAIKGGVTRLLTLTVSNTGDHPERPAKGHYLVRMGQRGQQCLKRLHANPTRTGTVESHNRNSLPVVDLIRKALDAVCNKDPR